MIAQLIGVDVLSVLLNYLEAEIERRGWTWTDLAEKAGVSKAVFTRWRRHPDSKVETETFVGLSEALGVSIMDLLVLYGIDPGVLTSDFDDQRLRLYLQSDPQARAVAETLMRAHPDDRQAILAFVQWRESQRRDA